MKVFFWGVKTDMYNAFSAVYDSLTQDVNYKKRAQYIISLFKKHDRIPTLLLDMACGTGSFALEFANSGIEVIGVDMSADMLSVAASKADENQKNILLLCQKASELELYGTVDGAVCLLDSLNHITDYTELCQSIAKIAMFLEKDRLFIFDVNTEYKHSEILGDNTFIIEKEDVFCIWQNAYNKKKKITDITLDFFCRNGDGYSRFTEKFSERAYSDRSIEKALQRAGLKTEAVYAENTTKKPTDKCQRKIYVARKV